MLTLITAKIWPYIAGGLAILAGLWGYGRKKQADGRRAERQQAKEADYENADDIRRRAGDADQRLREYDDAGYRD